MAISHVRPSCGATIRPGLVILIALALVLCLLPLSAHGGGVPGAPTPATCACQPRATLSVWMFGHGDPANSAGWARLRAGFLESAKAMRVQTETFFLTTRELRAGGGDAAAGVANLITAQLLTPTEVQIVPNAILLSIPSAAAISAVLDLVRARFPGIRIATYGEGSALAASVGSLFHLGQDDEAAGTQAGVRLAQTGATSAVCVFDILGSLTQKTRCTAFATAFRANCVASSCSVNTTFLDSSDASFSAAFINGLKQGPGGKPHIGLLSVSPNLLPLLNSPIAALGLASPVASLASFDVTPLAQQMLSSNSTVALSFVVDQQEYAQGSLALTLTTYYLTTGQKVANAFIQTGPKLVFTVSEFVPPVLAHLHLDAIVHGLNSDAFWSVFHEGVEMAARDLGLQFTDCTDPASTCDFKTTRSLSKPSVYYNAPANSFDLVTMSHQIDVAVAAKPNGIAVSLPSVSALQESITAGVRSGIPMISLNSGHSEAASLGMLSHVGQDEYLAGLAVGEYFASRNVLTCLCANQEPSNSALILRCQGVHDAMVAANPSTYCTQVPTSDDAATATQLLISAIQSQSTAPGALVVAGGGSLGSVVAAAQSTGLVPQGYSTAPPTCLIGSFDWLRGTQDGMLANQVQIIIHQQQHNQGWLPIHLLYLHALTNNLPLTPILLSGPAVILPSNMDVFNCLDAPLCPDPVATNGSSVAPRPDWIADGWCDPINNIGPFYDGGDCCHSTCAAADANGVTPTLAFACHRDYYSTGRNNNTGEICKDPLALENYCVANPGAARCSTSGDSTPVSANMSDSQRAGWTAVAAFGLAVVATFAVGLFILRTQFVFVSSSPPFLFLLLVGASMLLIGAILVALPQTTAICQAKVWISHLGLDLMIGTLLVKTARLSFIFNQANLARLSKTNLSNELLMSALGVICLVDVLLLAVWSGAGPLTADSVTSACSSSIETPLTAALLAYKGILIVSSLVYVYRCRDIPSSFNETAHLSVCFYNLSFVGWLLVVVILALGGSIADSTQSSIKAFGLIYVAITTSCILLVPKFNAFRKAEAAFATAGNSSIANGSMLASGIGGLSSSLDHSNKSYTLTGEEQKHRRAPSFHATDPNSAGQVEQANMILRQQMLDHARLGALSQQIKTESTRLARLKDDVCKLQLQLLKQQTELNFLEQTHGVRPQYSVVEKSVQAEQAHSNSPTVARGSIAARSPGKSTVSGLGASSQSSLRYHSGGGRTIAPAFPMTPHPNSTRASVSSQTTIASPSAVSAGGSTLATTTTPPTDVSPIVLEEIHVAAAITFSAAAAAQCSPPEEGLRSPLRIHLSSNSKHAGVFQPTARSPSSAQRSVEMV